MCFQFGTAEKPATPEGGHLIRCGRVGNAVSALELRARFQGVAGAASTRGATNLRVRPADFEVGQGCFRIGIDGNGKCGCAMCEEEEIDDLHLQFVSFPWIGYGKGRV